jgi:cytoskeletal protein CcmA (bactofilin family)
LGLWLRHGRFDQVLPNVRLNDDVIDLTKAFSLSSAEGIGGAWGAPLRQPTPFDERFGHQVFGRIEGELRASDLLISDGAQVEGTVIAQSVTICGRVKGTIRAVRVRLQNGGAVEGDIFHRSLSIDENAQFEGSSRRVENPTESSSSVGAKGPQKKGAAPAPLLSINAELTDGSKH